MKRLLLMVLAASLTFGVLPAFAATKVLRVGSDTTYPPFEFQDEKTGKYKGFSIDLIEAIADVMGMEAKIISTAWDGIIPGLINGNYDVLISSMTITEERKQAVNFSDPYFVANQAIVTRKDTNNIKVAADLKNKKVGVQISTTGDIAASEIKGAKISRYDTTPNALMELMNGAVDACVVDEPLARYFITQYPKLKIVNNDFDKEYYGIAVHKKNTALLKDVNEALKKLRANGVYDKIYNKVVRR